MMLYWWKSFPNFSLSSCLYLCKADRLICNSTWLSLWLGTVLWARSRLQKWFPFQLLFRGYKHFWSTVISYHQSHFLSSVARFDYTASKTNNYIQRTISVRRRILLNHLGKSCPLWSVVRRRLSQLVLWVCFEVLLTVRLSIIFVTDQLNAPILVL
jgi:hypothetical protein